MRVHTQHKYIYKSCWICTALPGVLPHMWPGQWGSLMSKLCMSFSVNLSPGDKFEFHTLRVETILLLGVYLFRWNTADYIPDCSEPNYSCDLEFKSSLSLTFGLDFQEKNVVLTLQTLSSQHCFASKVNQKGRKLISWTSLPEASDVACLAWLHYKLLV